MSILSYIILFFVFLLIASGLFIVKQQTAIIERFGRFLLFNQPGLHIKIPLIDKLLGDKS